MPPRWWRERWLRMTRTREYQQGRKLAEHQRRQGLGPDAAVKQEGHTSTRERSLAK